MILRLLAIVAIVVVAALPSLPLPFTGDQALFAIGGRTISGGGVIYRDFWDIKQPGIFCFYAVAGSLFEFTEIGIHLFEMLWWLSFAVVLCFALRRSFGCQSLPIWPAALTVGVYYGLAAPLQLTQVEALVGFPLFLSVWCASEATRGKRPLLWLIASGFFGGIVLLFKLFFCLILAACWLHTIVVRSRNDGWVRGIATGVGAPTLGLALVFGPVLLWFDRYHLLPLVYQTTFEYPPRMIASTGWQGLGTLASGLRWFAQSFAPSLALAAIAFFLPVRMHGRDLSIKLVLWAAVGLLVILLQRRSWWSYHYMLLIVPLGVLAGRGLGALNDFCRAAADRPERPRVRWIVSVAAMLLFLPIYAGWAERFALLGIHRGAQADRDRLAFGDHFSPNSSAMYEETAFLRSPEVLTGPIFVFGDPLLYWYGQRVQCGAIHGWLLELVLPEIAERLAEQLRQGRPPYIFVHKGYRDKLLANVPGIGDLLNRDYTTYRSSGGGVWYVRKTDGAKSE